MRIYIKYSSIFLLKTLFTTPVYSSMLSMKKGIQACYAKAQFNRIGTVDETTCASIELKRKDYSIIESAIKI